MVLALEHILYVCPLTIMVMPFAVCSEFVDDEEFYDNPSAWSVFETENRNLSESANTQDFVKLGSSSSQAPLLQSFSAMVRTPQHHWLPWHPNIDISAITVYPASGHAQG